MSLGIRLNELLISLTIHFSFLKKTYTSTRERILLIE